MSQILYQSKIIQIGDFAKDALADGMLITFKQGAPADLADYCFIHEHVNSDFTFLVGQTLSLGENSYRITAVGDVVHINFKELGHITIRFDGSDKANLPGNIHVQGAAPANLNVNDMIVIQSN